MSRLLTVLSKKVVKTLRPQHERYSHELVFVVLSAKERLPVQEKPRKHATHPVTDGQIVGGVAGRVYVLRANRFQRG